MNLQLTINIPKEKVELLKKYNYDFESNCEARILMDWQDTWDTEEQIQRRKKIWDTAYAKEPFNLSYEKKPTTK